MVDYIPTYTDISDWNIKVFLTTSGTRSKKIVEHTETGNEYFFKGSKELDTGEIRYPQEFWSEIVSSKIGQVLGFNVLDYNIAYNKNSTQKIGCLSKSMVDYSENKLTEGKLFLTGFDPSYNPEQKEHKKRYTFQFIKETLEFFNYGDYVKNILEIIIFDALIGNSDRHQENWGIITNFKETLDDIEKEIKSNKKMLGRLILIFKKIIAEGQSQKNKSGNVKKQDFIIESDFIKNSFSPIYDSGCCLGRENLDEKIVKMLANPPMIDKYLMKGVSEIHWEGENQKQNHFTLIKLLQEEYRDEIAVIIAQVEENFNSELIENIVTNIDQKLPESLNSHKLGENRKLLMVKLLNLRFKKLLELK